MNPWCEALIEVHSSLYSGLLSLGVPVHYGYRRHGLNAFDYLMDLFMRLPAAKITEVGQFTPAEWVKEMVIARAA